MTCHKAIFFTITVFASFVMLGVSQTVDSSRVAIGKADIKPAAACKSLRNVLLFQSVIVLPPDKEWNLRTKEINNGGSRIRIYDIWVNPDGKTKGKGFRAKVTLSSGMLISFDNIARNYERNRTDRSRLPLKYGTKAKADQLLSTVATKLGVRSRGSKLEFQHKLNVDKTPSLGAVIRDSKNMVVATIECDPVDGAILHFWRSGTM